jgi:hypothetical protein
MLILKDGGNGVTPDSLEFWKENKDKIGIIRRVEVSKDSLQNDIRKSDWFVDGYPVEYTFIAYGDDGVILLSGCNSGYGGTGPNGTAKILTEFDIPVDIARKIMLSNHINIYPDRKMIEIDNVTELWETLKEKHLSRLACKDTR